MNYSSAEAHTLFNFMVTLRESSRMEHFNELVPLLAEDCLLESEWLSVHETGKTAVKAWLDDALEDRCNKNIVWHYGVAEILSAPDASALQGPFGFHIQRETDCDCNSILITADVDTQGKVNRIRIVDAEPYTFQVFFRCIRLIDYSGDRENGPNTFMLPDTYWDYLRVGMACDGFRISKHSRIFPGVLLEGLGWWRRFCKAKYYDDAFEKLTGVSYFSDRCVRPESAIILGRSGKHMWENREHALAMANHLTAWAAGIPDRSRRLRLYEYPTFIDCIPGGFYD